MSKRPSHCLILIVLLCLTAVNVCLARSLSPIPRFQTLSKQQGLASSGVTAIAQDKQGFIWLGGHNGLARFDGYKLKYFFADNTQAGALSNDNIRSLLVDRQGVLWVGTLKGGLNRFDAKTQSFDVFRHDANDPESISSDTIRVLLEDQAGALWLGTDKGLDLFDSKTAKTRHFVHDPNNPHSSPPAKQTRAILKTRKGLIFVGTLGGLAWYQPKTDTFTKLDLPGVAQPAVRALLEDKQGQVWIATLQGLFKYDPLDGSIQNYHQQIGAKRLLSLARSSDGTLWIGSNFDGIYVIGPDNKVSNYRHNKNDSFSLPDNVVLSLLVDETGVLWSGTFNAGVSRLDPASLAFGRFNEHGQGFECLSSGVIKSIHLQHQSSLWLGTLAGLARVDTASGDCRLFQHDSNDTFSLPHNFVNALYQDSKQQLWIGTNAGVAHFDAHLQRFNTAKGQIQNTGVPILKEDNSGRLVAGSYLGLFAQKAESTEFVAVSLKDQRLKGSTVVALAIDSNQRWWVATYAGLAIFDADSHSMDYLRLDNGLGEKQVALSEPVNALYIEKKSVDTKGVNHDIVWIGTRKNGLFRFDTKTNRLSGVELSINSTKLPELKSIYADDAGQLWLGTSNGLLKYDPVSTQLREFHRSDGLQGEDFVLSASFQAADGQLFFGGRKGFNRFYPADIKINTEPPKVAITAFYHFNETVEPGGDNSAFNLPHSISHTKEVRLSHRDESVGFEFAALDYADPSRNRYAYKMVGFDRDWNNTDAKNRRATYTNLDAGSYTFRVKAANKNGVWNEQGVTLKVVVLPAPWATWWAYTAYVLMVVAGFIAYIKHRTRALTKRAEQLQLSVEQRTKELAAEKNTVEQLLSKKNDEFANVSHEFRTPLTLVLGPVKKLLQSEVEPGKQNALAVIQRNGYRLLRMVDQLLDMEKFKVQQVSHKTTQPLQQMLSLIAQSFEDLAAEKQISLTVNQIDDVYLECVPDALEKICVNLLSNAIKYTPQGGKIWLSAIRTGQQQVLIEVADNGIGIPTDKQQSVFERFHRVLDQHSEKVTGAGIGLALVKELVEAHSGEITLDSEVGKGTRMSVLLPILEQTPDEAVQTNANRQVIELELENLGEQQPGPHVADQTQDNETDSQPTLLIIEDNPDMRSYIHQSLADDYNCLLEPNGKAGFERALVEVPDIIVSDVMMPLMDGYEVTKAIKSDDRTSHIPVVLLTARGDRESRLKGWQEKADEYLTKPFDPEELQIRINNLLCIRDILTKRFSQSAFALPETPAVEEVAPPSAEEQKLAAQQVFLDKLNAVLESTYTEQKVRVGDIAEKMAMGEWQLLRKLKGTVDMTIAEYIRRFRLEKACQLLAQGMNANTVALEVGFSSHSYFSRCFSAQYGCAPSEYGN